MARKRIAIVPTMIIAQMLAAEEAYGTLPPQYRTDFIANEMAIRRQYLNSQRNDDIEPSIHQANMASLKNYIRKDYFYLARKHILIFCLRGRKIFQR